MNEELLIHQAEMFIMSTLEIYPIIIMEDKQGAIKLTNNKFRSERTRHIDESIMLFTMRAREGYTLSMWRQETSMLM